MKLKIQKIYSRGSGKINEDEFLIKDNLFAVFDGATSLIGYADKRGRTGGRIAAEIAKDIFSQNSSSLKNLAIITNKKIRAAMIKSSINVKNKEEIWSAGFAAVRIKKREIEYASILDCLILVIFKNNSHKLLNPYINHDLTDLISWKKLADRKTKNIRSEMKVRLIKTRKAAGIKYSSLNGLENVEKFLKFGKINLKNIKSIILFTDGFLLPKRDPEREEDWKTFVKLYQARGIKGVLDYVRRLEATDPNCWKYPRVKQYDDATAVSIDLL
jgi:hypothetical protein